VTALDETAQLSAEQREELIKLHEYDELIFGGFICLQCTPDDCDDPDDNVYYPCPPLRAVGVTNEEAVLIIKLARAERERDRYRAELVKEQARSATLEAALGHLNDVLSGVGGLSVGLLPESSVQADPSGGA